jgi:hypothetical protein
MSCKANLFNHDLFQCHNCRGVFTEGGITCVKCKKEYCATYRDTYCIDDVRLKNSNDCECSQNHKVVQGRYDRDDYFRLDCNGTQDHCIFNEYNENISEGDFCGKCTEYNCKLCKFNSRYEIFSCKYCVLDINELKVTTEEICDYLRRDNNAFNEICNKVKKEKLKNLLNDIKENGKSIKSAKVSKN